MGGAKNAVLPGMAAAILFEGPLRLSNVPDIIDIETLGDILRAMGAMSVRSDDTIEIDTTEMRGGDIPPELMSKLRASIILTGPILARFGKVSFSHPGGDVIGERPIDFFIDVFKKMGASVSREDTVYHVEAPQGLHGAELFFRVQSVTGTETAMLAATRADGTTTIKNAALEPEIVWLADLLNASGAHIEGAGTTTVTIVGSQTLLLRAPNTFAVMPDRIEAGSFAILAALLGKDVLIEQCEPSHLDALWDTFTTIGVPHEITGQSVRVHAPETLRPVTLRTHEYPGFPTDLMAPMVPLLTQAMGQSRVFETIWDNRLAFTETLVAMGADITLMDPHRVLITGPKKLVARNVESLDIRAGLALLIAAALADGISNIGTIHHIDRGYANLAERLQKLGLQIERVTG